jgi:peptidyl-prolyl cis-trans isomerase C
MKRLLFLCAASCLPLLVSPVAFSQTEAEVQGAAAKPAEAKEAPRARDDIIARVGDQPITWGEVNTALNSSAIVGVSIPAVGTPERDKTLILLLDKFISANLTYLDALKQGLDKDPVYQRDVAQFENAMLAGLYRRHVMLGEIPVTKEEIDGYLEKHKAETTASPEDVRLGAEVKLRRQKMKERLVEASQHIRDGVTVVVQEQGLATAGDASRPDTAVLAEVDGKPITWGEVKGRIIAAGKAAVQADPLAMEGDARKAALQEQIDLRIVAQRARAAGLDQDRQYKVRVNEYRRSRLINLRRDQLIAGMEPTKDELKAYYEANKARLVQPETRKVQMVVVKTEEEAEDLKRGIEAGQITMYQAAQDHSIAPTAKEDLGEIGWVSKGKAVPALDEVIFALGPGAVGGPVETPAGWHLVTVQDVQEAKYDDFGDAATQKLVRREWLDDKLNAYAVNLRTNEFPVVVYQDVLVRLSQQAADAVAKLAEKAKQPGSVTEQRVKELQKLMKR